jgi:hypothetical protein
MATDKILPISLVWYRSDKEDDDYVVYVQPMWPINISSEDIVKKHLREFIEKQIKDDVKKGYLKVEVETHNKVKVIFKSEQWMRDNFLKKPKVKFHIPRTLEFKFKKRLPDGLMGHTDWNLVRKYLEARFKKFLKDHKKAVFQDKAKIMKKVNPEWFEYEANLQWNKIFVRVKASAMMTIAIGAYTVSQATKKKKVDSWENMI